MPPARSLLSGGPTQEVLDSMSSKSKSTAQPPHPPTEEKKLAALEERLAHELMPDDEERQELRDRILRLGQRQED